MNDWVTVATFTYPHQAGILRSKLESEGIECFAKDEDTLSAQPFYSNAIGGVKIQVRQNDVERANEIVKNYYYNTNNEEVDPQEEYKPEEPSEKPKEIINCPVCGSDEVHIDKTPSQLRILAVFLLGIPLLFPEKKKYHCFNCGANFKKQ